MSLDLSSHWKGAAHISVPFSLSTASGGSSFFSSRMTCMAAAVLAPCCWSEVVPRRTWRICLCNRKYSGCRLCLLGTRCGPPGHTAAVLLARTRWSSVGGSSSAQGGTVCNFPQQPRLSRWTTMWGACPGLSTAWRLQSGYPPGPLNDSAERSDVVVGSFFPVFLGMVVVVVVVVVAVAVAVAMMTQLSYGSVCHWANGFWSVL